MSGLPAVHLAGNCAVDLVAGRADARSGERAMDLAGLEIVAEPPHVLFAGNAAWPAWLLAEMGHPVQLNAPVGRDLFGIFLRRRLREAGVELVGLDAGTTAVSLLSSTEGGLRTGTVYPGEPIDWQRSERALSAGSDAHWFFAAGYTGFHASDADDLKHLFALLRDRQVQIVFDPGPWLSTLVGRDRVLDLLAMVNCLSATAEELADWFSPGDPALLAQRALDHGVESVAMKRGRDGAFFAGRNGPAGQVATAPVPGASTVGAGDTFNAGLLHGLSTGMSLADTVAYAVRLATEVVRVGRADFRADCVAKPGPTAIS